jgi:hypothetical protein
MHIISAIACVEADGRVAVWALWRMSWMSWMGMGLTRLGVGDFVEAGVSGQFERVCCRVRFVHRGTFVRILGGTVKGLHCSGTMG